MSSFRAPDTTIVIPTVGRESLERLLVSLAASMGELPPIVVVDDRPKWSDELTTWAPVSLEVVHSYGRGPAAARNLGWKKAKTRWVSFLDDDVEVSQSWLGDLARDLRTADGASQGQIRVPRPNRPLTDDEQSVARLENAVWITADMSIRTSALRDVNGFDERFENAYREDTDLALRLKYKGWHLAEGTRITAHPLRDMPWWWSVSAQRGNFDDALMNRVHGPGWKKEFGDDSVGTFALHATATGSGFVAAMLRCIGLKPVSRVFSAVWLVITCLSAAKRISAGPQDRSSVVKTALTSIAIPPAATFWRALGTWRFRRARPKVGHPKLVLFDRDGTLVHDVPYNGDPSAVELVDDAFHAVDELRQACVLVGVVTNQSGIARGLLTPEQVDGVNARIDAQLGGLDTWQVCPHGVDEGCDCRKPEPGLIKHACAEFDVAPEEVVVIGDIASDVRAAERAGAYGILVPNAGTDRRDIEECPVVCSSLYAAVEAALAVDATTTSAVQKAPL